MSGHKIKVSSAKLAEILKVAMTAPSANADHLGDEEFASYASEMLSDDGVKRIDNHLASCPDCCRSMEELLAAPETWRNLDGPAQVAKIRSRIKSEEPAMPSPKQLLSKAVSAALGTPVQAGVRDLLARWQSWISSAAAESLQIRNWKPVSVSGLLAPTAAGEADVEIGWLTHSEASMPRAMDVVVKASTELVS